MANEIATKGIEKPLSVIRKETVTNEQLADQLARLEDPNNQHTYFLLDVVVRDVMLQCTTDQRPLERGLIVRKKEKGWSFPKTQRRPQGKKQARALKRMQIKKIRQQQKATRRPVDDSE